MEERNYHSSTSRRRRKKKLNLMPFFVLGAAIIMCVTVITVISLIISDYRPDPTLQNPTVPSGPITTTPTEEPTDPEKTEPPTEPGPNKEALALMEKADFIAAGYDYEKAISMLQESEYYADSSEMAERVAYYQEESTKLVRYPTPEKTTHIFFHSLIADPARAFDNDGDHGGYNMYMTTISEFIAIMEQM